MREPGDKGRRGDCLKPTDPALLGDPLRFFHEEHLREREICAMLKEMATGETAPLETVTHVLGFLRMELPLHLEDEEQDLFPLLRRRCEPADEIGKAIERLSADHDRCHEQTALVVAVLGRLSRDDNCLTRAECDQLDDYVDHARRHLIFENAIILPFARLRLRQGDLQTLTLRMQQRRGIDRSTETHHAC